MGYAKKRLSFFGGLDRGSERDVFVLGWGRRENFSLGGFEYFFDGLRMPLATAFGLITFLFEGLGDLSEGEVEGFEFEDALNHSLFL